MKNLMVCVLFIAGGLLLAQKPHAGRVTGKVLTISGDPIEGVTIDLKFADPTSEKWNAQGITTKGNGGFVQVALPSGGATLSLSKEGFESREYTYTQDQSTVNLKIRMLKEGQTITDAEMGPQPLVKGTIIDTEGNPLPEVTLIISSQDFPGYTKTYVTAADGTFDVESIGDAKVEILCKKEGYRDEILRYNHTKGTFKLKKGELRMMTIEQAMKEAGIEKPEMTPRDKAILKFNDSVDPYQAKDYALAEQLAKEAVAIDPTLDKAVQVVVYSNYFQQDWDEAAEYAQKYLELVPDNENMMKLAVEVGGKSSKGGAFAKKVAAKLREMTPVTPDSLYREVIDALNANDDATAKAKSEEILKMDEKYALAYFELGKIYVREYEFESAILNLKKYLKYAPEGSPAAKHRAEATELIVTLSE
ncbi:carboxypeptidase-like regulatory domain-containing protein [Acanthopleuribacter pedis]|uniref:Carboxypeptidase regulatory-like domain-containing protein n=1 Tax=Acanthopleuribacter pedis TaxID=442870 RepID=A0A8J7QE14_9BACT|nr:carboxypeptidase-like regulatory domain-containing protein [Acanthopleuribacter pedis]MBO1322114.1 carboxypeptidase regulatory-like domain-containing protein [Acanthopleuribacter pedis]